MAERNLNDQPTLNETELADAIIAVQGGTPKQWRKVTPSQLVSLMGMDSYRRTHVATATVAPDSYITGQLIPWALTGDAPSELTLLTLNDQIGSELRVGNVPLADWHSGWRLQVYEDDTPVDTVDLNIGYTDEYGGRGQRVLTTTSTCYFQWELSQMSPRVFRLYVGRSMTIEADYPVLTCRLYMTQ